jgi:phosphoenolpyruvate carboxykinase (GTP)
MLTRCNGSGNGNAVESPIGMLPTKNAIDTTGLDLPAGAMDELLTISKDDWRKEADNLGEFFAKFGNHLPQEMNRQRDQLIKRLE